MWFTAEEFEEFFNALYEAINFIIQPILGLFEQLISYPMLAYAFFVPTGLGLIWLTYEFILWASDFRLAKDNVDYLTNKRLKENKRNKYREEQNKKAEERFLANYEQRDNYYNAMLMSKAAQQQENEEYHKNLLAENKRYHDGILDSKSKPDKDVSFDIELAKEKSKDRVDFGNMKRRTPRSVRNENNED